MNTIKLYIPTGCHRNAKLNGAIYDKDTKTWYCDINDKLCIDWYERKYLREPTTDNEIKNYMFFLAVEEMPNIMAQYMIKL